MLSETQLKSIMPNCTAARRQTCLLPLNVAMHRFRINSVPRAAAFLAQLAHESGEFRWMEELWGREPTPAQRRYEPQSRLAAQLGNTQPGDGKRFKGRGPIQITGRANYKRYGDLLGVDLISRPERAADPDIAFDIAGLYWATNHLNELADAGQFVAITKRINGGTNGLADREKYHARAQDALAGGVFGDEPPRPRGAGGIELTVPLDELVPLLRGSEALRELEDEGEDAAAVVEGLPARRAPAANKEATGVAGKASRAKKVPDVPDAGVPEAAAGRKPASAKPAAKKTALKAPRRAARQKPLAEPPASEETRTLREAVAAKRSRPGRTAAETGPAAGRAAAGRRASR